jgi:hypothetical protein
MAVFLSTAADYLTRTTDLLSTAGNRTWCVWTKQGTIPTAGGKNLAMASINLTPSTYTQYGRIVQNDTPRDQLALNIDTSVETHTASAAVDVWVYHTWVTSGTTQRYYRNGTLIGNVTQNLSHLTSTYDLLGGDSTGVGDYSLAYCRQWTTALSQTEILAELQSTTAVKTANLWMDCPLTSDTLDLTGLNHCWIVNGSVSYVASPTFPSNSTAATATAFSTLPQTITQDFGDGLFAWYSYTGHANEITAGFWAYADINVDTLTTQVYEADGTTTFLGILAINVPMQVPQSSGVTVYLKVSAGSPPSTAVTVSGVLAPTSAVPVGSVMVNDDEVGFPVAMLSASSGLPLQFAHYPSGELVEVTPATGQTLSDNIDTLQLNLIDSTLAATIAIPYPTASTLEGVSSDQAGTYYVGFQNKHVYTVDDAGVVGGTSWTLANNVRALAPSLDNTILYYASGIAGSPIYRWDLVNDMALSDLVGGVASHIVARDLLVLQDGTIVAGYQKDSATSDYSVVVYSAAGATLHTYNSFGAGNKVNRLTHAIDDPNSFWVWLYLDNAGGANAGFSRFINVKVSDGSSLTTLTVVQYEQGAYQGAATATPDRFGHSFSCPFWIQRSGDIPTPPTPIGDPVATTIRRERIFRHLSDEQQWIFYQWLQIDCEAGVGLSTGQGSDPQIILQWSDDGGHTWSNEHLLSAGKQGEYSRRAILKQPLGRSRDRVFKVAMSDPVKWALLNAYFGAEKGTS